MIDIAQETLLTLREATRLLPGRPHISTLHRWRSRGIRSSRLETVLIGGRRYTSREALQRFVARISGENSPALSDVTGRRAAEIAAAEQELDVAGL